MHGSMAPGWAARPAQPPHSRLLLCPLQVMNMITIDAHSRDVVQQMVESGAADHDCFAWQAQLRTYWDR